MHLQIFFRYCVLNYPALFVNIIYPAPGINRYAGKNTGSNQFLYIIGVRVKLNVEFTQE
jgi:hypothetical protein